MRVRYGIPILVLLLLMGCRDATAKKKTTGGQRGPRVTQVSPGFEAQEQLQVALLRAQRGDLIEFSEGVFEFTQGLSLSVEDVTLRGKGMDKTILSFKNQASGPTGLSVTRGGLIVEDLSIDDAKGDAFKVVDADGVILRRVQARWNGEPKATNAPYGLSTVQCKNVLIEDCVAIGASDAGIHVGQSQFVVVRRCRAERNVAGFEIENCTSADVFENISTNNTGGIFVLDRPGLPAKNGRLIRVFNNQVLANNHPNFASPGNLVATLPPGTGIAIMAADDVEVFKNVIKKHHSPSINVASFPIAGRTIEDKEYDPYPEGVSIHDNEIYGGGEKPNGVMGNALVTLLGNPLPDILYDGVENPARRVNGKLPTQFGVSIRNNGKATFANLQGIGLDPQNLHQRKDKITRNLKPHDFEFPSIPAVTLREMRSCHDGYDGR
jgi:parallel beta-helix repeat protein